MDIDRLFAFAFVAVMLCVPIIAIFRAGPILRERDEKVPGDWI